MYSGQEIVSQEECKIILAEFYEGVNCYNEDTREISFTLLDWATATYDTETLTLHTKNFSCRPLVMVQEDIKIAFMAQLDSKATGLEVTMHTADYEKIRVMPLIYLEPCSPIDWGWPYPDEIPYIVLFCNEDTETKVEFIGEIDAITPTKITIVGNQEEALTSPLHLEFLDASQQLLTITPTFTTEIREDYSWEFNEENQEYEKRVVEITVTIMRVALAHTIRFSGIVDYEAVLYSCTFSIGDIYEYCNLSDPYETRILATTDNYEELSDGWFKLDTTEFRLLPTNEFLRKEDQTYFFSGADQIEFRNPTQQIFNIFSCSYFIVDNIADFCSLLDPNETKITSDSDNFEVLADDWFRIENTEFTLLPSHSYLRKEDKKYYFGEAEQIEFRTPIVQTFDLYLCSSEYNFDYFYVYILFYYDKDLDTWLLELYIVGSYIIENGVLIDVITNERYTFYTSADVFLDLDLGSIETDNDTTTLILTVPTCQIYYDLDGIVHDVDPTSVPYSDDYRVVWDWSKCKFIVTCESIGLFPCPCISCDNEPDEESVHIYSDNTPSETCSKDGILPEKEIIGGCGAGLFHTLGKYPDIPAIPKGVPSPAVTTVKHVYFRGLQMYIFMKLPGMNQWYEVPMGNLSYGVELKEVEDGATKTKQTVNLLPYIYLDIFKFPYKYVKRTGLDWRLWHDKEIWSDDFIRFSCIEPNPGVPCFGWEVPPCEKNWPPKLVCDEDYGKTEAELAMKGITAAGGFDFKIELSELLGRLPAGWKETFDWQWGACAWISAEVKRKTKQIDEIITTENTNLIDEMTCDTDLRVRYISSNTPLIHGTGVIPPANAAGAFQVGYDKYVTAVNMLISKDAEAFAYYNGVYKQSLK